MRSYAEVRFGQEVLPFRVLHPTLVEKDVLAGEAELFGETWASMAICIGGTSGLGWRKPMKYSRTDGRLLDSPATARIQCERVEPVVDPAGPDDQVVCSANARDDPLSAARRCSGGSSGRPKGTTSIRLPQGGVGVVGEGVGPPKGAQLPDEKVALPLAGAHQKVTSGQLVVEVVNRGSGRGHLALRRSGLW